MYQGFFINLDRNVDRRERFVANLRKTQVASRYERFAAIDGAAAASTHPTKLEAGALGCWLSHEAVLRQALGAAGGAGKIPERHVHIVEDDVLLAPGIGAAIDSILPIADERDPAWDLIFTEIFMTPELRVFLRFAKAITDFRKSGTASFLPLKASGFAGTSSYIVNRRSIEKVLRVIDGAWARGAALDIYLRAAIDQNHLKAYLTVPFLTTISPSADTSDIRGAGNRSRAVFDNLRRAFYVHADLDAQLAWLKNVIPPDTPMDQLRQVYLETVRFILSDEFEMF